MVDRMDINQLLLEMRQIKKQTQGFQGGQSLAAKDRVDKTDSHPLSVHQEKSPPDFSQLFEQAINKVNDTQHASSALKKAYTQGDTNVDITDVMVASQKAGVSFQAMVQVRNKLIEAYRDIMNMPL